MLISLSVVKKYAKTLFIDFSWTMDVVNAHAPKGKGSETTTYLKFPTPICLFTVQPLWSHDDD